MKKSQRGKSTTKSEKKSAKGGGATSVKSGKVTRAKSGDQDEQSKMDARSEAVAPATEGKAKANTGAVSQASTKKSKKSKKMDSPPVQDEKQEEAVNDNVSPAAAEDEAAKEAPAEEQKNEDAPDGSALLNEGPIDDEGDANNLMQQVMGLEAAEREPSDDGEPAEAVTDKGS